MKPKKEKKYLDSFDLVNINLSLISKDDIINNTPCVVNDYINKILNDDEYKEFEKYIKAIKSKYFYLIGYQIDLSKNLTEINNINVDDIGILILIDSNSRLQIRNSNRLNIFMNNEENLPERTVKQNVINCLFEIYEFGSFGPPIKPGLIGGSFRLDPRVGRLVVISTNYTY